MEGEMENIALPGKIKNILADFVRAIKDIYKDGLVSVVLYGSAARGDFSRRYSNINLAVVLIDARLDNLKRASGVIKEHCFRLLNVIFLTEEYVNRSADVFPIEFLDMKENNIVLYGRDVLKGLKIDVRNLRFQCEQELKAKLVNMKTLYLKNNNLHALRGLLFRSVTSVMHIVRSLARSDAAPSLGIKTEYIDKILEAKKSSARLGRKETEALFSKFVTELEGLIDIVDRI